MSRAFVRLSLMAQVALPVAAWLSPVARWPLLGLLVADHLAVVGAGLWPRSSLLGPNLRRLPPGSVAEDEVVLTLDDGPDPETTRGVLRILREHEARASFFCIGERVVRHGDLIERIARDGHRVENHTFEHPKAFYFFGRRAMAEEIDRTQAAIERATARSPRYFRAPAGIRNPLLEGLLEARQLRLVSWSRRAFDTVRRDSVRIADELTNDVAPGEILLLHDRRTGYKKSRRPVVFAALRGVLERLSDRGFRATHLPDEWPREQGRFRSSK